MDSATVPFRVLSARDFDENDPGRRKRPAHKKTRTGCLSCKAKKVKCDEAKPTCLRCQRNSWSCSYDAPTARIDTAKDVQGTSTEVLLQHMVQYWADIFPMQKSDTMTQLAKDEPVVQSALLAITACHLQHLNPFDIQHRIAVHHQQSRAIQECTKWLTTPISALSQPGVNIMLLGTNLVNFLAFTIPDSEDDDEDNDDLGPCDPLSRCSWTFTPQPDRPDWIGLQTSLRHLLSAIAPYVHEALAFLSIVLLGDRNEPWAFTRLTLGLSIVPEHWIRFFDLSELEDLGASFPPAEDLASEPIRFPAIMLSYLRALSPEPHNVFQMQHFLGKMQPNFRALLCARDERAVWLLGFWLGLMCRFDGLWWFGQGFRGDYDAVCSWLASRPLEGRLGDQRYLWGKMMADLRSVAS